MNAQIIEKDGQPEWAVIPFAEYQQLLELAERAQDISEAEQARQSIAEGEEETIPAEVVNRLFLEQENPLKVWREYRGFTQDELAQAANVGKSYISQIETGKKTGSVKVIKALADVLQLDMDNLIAAV